jgi:outer membrane protein assembly factor BamB
VADGVVYIASASVQGKLAAFAAAGCGQQQCQPLWTAPLDDVESSPVVAGGVVYVGKNNNRVYAFGARGCGSRVCDNLWEYITQDPIVNSSPVMVNGTLYVGGTNFGFVPELYVFTLA